MVTPDVFKETRKLRSVFNSAFFEEQANHLAEQTVSHFRKITRFYALFHMGYFALGFLELLGLLLFFPFFAKSLLIAFSLGAVFLTVFSYFVLRFYFQAKKPEQFFRLKTEFIDACKRLLPSNLDPSPLLTHAVYRLISKLEGQEHQYYQLSEQFKTLAPLLEKFSLWCHWKDVHQMKETLHHYCIHKRVEFVKLQPTDIETHASLANSYIALYKECLPPKTLNYGFIAKEYASESMKEKFQSVAKRAIEEFKIIDAYAPNDPWVYAQLAVIYHDLNFFEKELETYEILLRIAPQDSELLLRCGALYFQQGRIAQGLKIYEHLKKSKDPKADELIGYYDVF